ncbi:MAG: DUF6462 family protein [Lachnospiraceae bacterium]
MAYSYKCYSHTKDVMKKYVNASEGAVIYSIGKTRIMTMAKEANAIYKIGNSALINVEVFDGYLEQFRQPARPLPKHIYQKYSKQDKTPNIGGK